MDGSSPITAAGPCRIHTGFPILPAGGTSHQFMPGPTVPRRPSHWPAHKTARAPIIHVWSRAPGSALCPGTYYGRKRRPPSTRAQRDAGPAGTDHRRPQGQLRRLRGSPSAQATAAPRRQRGPMHGGAADTRAWSGGRAAWDQEAHRHHRCVGAAATGPGQPALRRGPARSVVASRHHRRTDLGSDRSGAA